MMPTAIVNPRLQQLLGMGTGSEFAELFVLWLPSRLARLLERLALSEQRALLRNLPRGRAVAALCRLPPEARGRLLNAHSDQELRKLLGGIRPFRQRAVLRQLPIRTALRLCRLLRWQRVGSTTVAPNAVQTTATLGLFMVLLPGGALPV
jgi:Mg/Co/Ni transporter MgtE